MIRTRFFSGAVPTMAASFLLAGGVALAPVAASAQTWQGQSDQGFSQNMNGQSHRNQNFRESSNGQTMQHGFVSLLNPRLEWLRRDLQIQPDQTQQWEEFRHAALEGADHLTHAFQSRSMDIGSMNAPQDLESFAQIQSDQASALRRIVPAFDNLYSVLTPPQRQEANNVFRGFAEHVQNMAMNVAGNGGGSE